MDSFHQLLKTSEMKQISEFFYYPFTIIFIYNYNYEMYIFDYCEWSSKHNNILIKFEWSDFPASYPKWPLTIFKFLLKLINIINSISLMLKLIANQNKKFLVFDGVNNKDVFIYVCENGFGDGSTCFLFIFFFFLV